MRLSRGSRYLIVMTLPWLFLLASAIAVFAIVHTSHAEVHPGAGPHPPVVVELFTSEGCSSCPPADRLLAEIQEQSRPGAEIIVLSEHVDYWNYIGWRDSFSSKQFSDRQSAYAQTIGSDEVYTPQMVVDGAAAFIGSDVARATQEIARAATVPKRSLNVTAKEVSGGVIEASVQPSELKPGGYRFHCGGGRRIGDNGQAWGKRRTRVIPHWSGALAQGASAERWIGGHAKNHSRSQS
jgi:hypothetical protein